MKTREMEQTTSRYIWSPNYQDKAMLHADTITAPSVWIGDGPIPSLAKAVITCHYLCSEDIVASELRIKWSIAGTGVGLQLLCRANDERLKEQYRPAPKLAEKIVDLLGGTPHARKCSAGSIEANIALSPDEVPEELQSFVTQAKVWETFLKKYQHGLHMCSAEVSTEGWLLLHIRCGSLFLYDEPPNPSEEGWSPKISEYFQFNPVLEPPMVTNQLVYWEVPDKMVLVILHHERSSEDCAKHFNYLKVYQRWVIKKNAYKRRMEEAWGRNTAKDAQKLEATIQERKQAILKDLLA